MKIQQKLNYSVMAVCVALLGVTGLVLYLNTSSHISEMVERELANTASLVTKIAKTSYDINQDRVNHNILLADSFVRGRSSVSYARKITFEAEDQVSHKYATVSLPAFMVGGSSVATDSSIVDEITRMTGGSVTIFQLFDGGMIRVSTSVVKPDGKRAVGTYIPKDSPVYAAILSGRKYEGRAQILGNWYISAYQPIFNAGRVIGAIYVGINQADLKDMSEKILSVKIGKTGYPFIMDGNGTMVVHPTSVGKNLSDQTHIREMLKNKKGNLVYRQSSSGEGEGRRKVVFYDSIPEMDWIVAVGSYEDEFYAPLFKLRIVLIVSLLVMVCVVFVVMNILSRYIVKPILVVVERLKDISEGEGDLTKRLSMKTGDEVELLADSFNAFVDKIEGVVATIVTGVNAIASASRELSIGNQSLSQRTEAQAANIEETASSLEEILSSIVEISSNVDAAGRAVNGTRQTTEEGRGIIADTMTDMEKTLVASTRIADIVKLIQTIAFQTNILALNASVEAARAGEHGRGFMVVASEVKKLAGSTEQSVKEITSLVENSVNSIDTVGKGLKSIEGLFNAINQNILSISDVMRGISVSTSEQKSGITSINKTMSDIDAITQQNSALVEEATAATEELFSQANQLSEVAGFFKVRDGFSAPESGRRG